MAERSSILLASHSQSATIASLAACHRPVYLVLEGEEGSGAWEVVELDSLCLSYDAPPPTPTEYGTFYGDRLFTDTGIFFLEG